MKKQPKEKKEKPQQPKPRRRINSRHRHEVTIGENRVYISIGKRRRQKKGDTNGCELLSFPNNAVPPEMRAFAQSLLEEISSRKSQAKSSRPTRLLGESNLPIIDAEEVPTLPKMQEEVPTFPKMQVVPGKNPETIDISWPGIPGDVIYHVSFKDNKERDCIPKIITCNSFLTLRLNRFDIEDCGADIRIEVMAGILPPGMRNQPENWNWRLIDSFDYQVPELFVPETDESASWDTDTEERPHRGREYIALTALLGILAVIFILFKYPNIYSR